MEQIHCPFCNNLISPTFFYCPVCGKKIKEAPVSTSLAKQLLIYSVSFFLPPFGLGWAFSYLKQENPMARRIGWVALILTVVSVIATIWVTIGFIHYYVSILNGVATGNLSLPSDQQKALY